MKMSSTQAKIYLQNVTIGDFKLEGVDRCTHLGSVVNNENTIWTFSPKP
jgi:hypothetical protein